MSRLQQTKQLLALASAFLLGSCAYPRCKAVDLVGYLPSYRMGDSNYVNNVLPGQLELLDEVRYFGITVNSQGGLTTTQANRNHLQTIVDKINSLPAEHRPRLGITLGGAGSSSGFPAIAASPTLQATLAQNVLALLNETGATGVDIDWEHPTTTQELTVRYPQMLGKLKEELGDTRRVYATVSPEMILPHSVFEGTNAVDGVSLMTYDISWWANDPADPNLGQHSLPEYVVDSVNAWTNTAGASIPRTYVFGNKKSVDAPEAKLGIGDPLYARGYNGSSANLAVAYRDLVASGSTTDGNSYVYSGSNVWLPGPSLVADRVKFADERGLQHIIFWEMYHDLSPSSPKSLLRAAFDARLALDPTVGDFNNDGSVDETDLGIWQANQGTATGATDAMGDADRDHAVDGADLLLWQQHFQSPPAGAASSFAIPEPATLAAGLRAALALGALRRGIAARQP